MDRLGERRRYRKGKDRGESSSSKSRNKNFRFGLNKPTNQQTNKPTNKQKTLRFKPIYTVCMSVAVDDSSGSERSQSKVDSGLAYNYKAESQKPRQIKVRIPKIMQQNLEHQR